MVMLRIGIIISMQNFLTWYLQPSRDIEVRRGGSRHVSNHAYQEMA